MAAELPLTQQQRDAMATSVSSNVNVDVAKTSISCPPIEDFSGTTIGLEYECSGIKAISSTKTSVLFTSAARASPPSSWWLVGVTRDISQISGSSASGTLEFVTGPIEADDGNRFQALFAFLENFFKQWKTGERDAAFIAGMMEQDGFAVSGIALPNPEKAKPAKKTTMKDDEDEFVSDDSDDEPVDMKSMLKSLGEVMVRPRFDGNNEELCNSVPQVNLGVQLDVLGDKTSKAAELLRTEFGVVVRYSEILEAVDSYLDDRKLGGNATFRGIIVLYAMITNVFADLIKYQACDDPQAVELILSGAWVDVSNVSYKNGWGALPKVKPWELWTPAQDELRQRYWTLLKGVELKPQSEAFAVAFCGGKIAAAAAVFAALAVGTISPNAKYRSFSAAPKPVDPFLIRSRSAIVIELRGSTSTTQALAIYGGQPEDQAKVSVTLAKLAALAI